MLMVDERNNRLWSHLGKAATVATIVGGIIAAITFLGSEDDSQEISADRGGVAVKGNVTGDISTGLSGEEVKALMDDKEKKN